MAFQTNTIVNGVWTTRTLNLNDVLQHHQKQDEIEKAAVEPHVPPPVYGLLTRTVIESPVVNWILPARIRHMDRNDVVFIGVCTFPPVAYHRHASAWCWRAAVGRDL